ncbi:MAG: MFS transporter [Chloroflexi bacterium]|nr:MFS transporter [Chloroflexota bacterium]
MGRGLSRPPFFYGWLIVAVAILAMMAGGGGLNYSFGALMSPMSAELGWSRAQISGAITLAGLMGALSGPWFGRRVDRAGGRYITAVCAVLGGATLLGVSRATELWQLYLLYGVALGLLMPGIGLSATTAVANWFVRKRPQATAIASFGVPLGGLAVLPLTQFLIGALDWRAAWVGLAGVMAILLAIPAALLIRRRPEDVGLLPDGAAFAAGADAQARQATLAASLSKEPRWSARQAMATPAFWLLLASFSLTSMGILAFLTNGQSHFITAGASPGTAAGALSFFAFGTVAARLVWAPAAAKIGSRRAVVMAAGFAGLALFAVAFSRSPAAMYISSAALGAGLGGLTPLQMQIWPDYYGRLSVGVVRGSAGSFQAMVGALGPFVAGGIFDLSGSYSVAFAIFGSANLIAATLAFFARQPAPPLALPSTPGESLAPPGPPAPEGPAQSR